VLCLQLFFAKVPSAATGEEVTQLFRKYGDVADLNLFRAWAGAKNSKVRAWHRPELCSQQLGAMLTALLWPPSCIATQCRHSLQCAVLLALCALRA
jgi:hypothetical protein